MRILVTGATGFVGSHLVHHLKEEGHQVGCIARPWSPSAKRIKGFPTWTVQADGAGLKEAFAELTPNVVVHLAAYYVSEHRFGDIERLVAANLLLGNYLLQAMLEGEVGNLVYAGTSWQHYQGQQYSPVNLYAATKQAFSTVAAYYREAAGLRVLELDLYDSYGEHDTRPRLLNLLQKAAQEGSELAMSPGEQLLHLVHVEDVCRGIVMACEEVKKLTPGEQRVYRLPSDRAISLKELVRMFNEADPANPAKVNWGGRPYRKREVFIPWEGADVLPGWMPRVPLREGLHRVRHAQIRQVEQLVEQG